jgi:hypothetical protein
MQDEIKCRYAFFLLFFVINPNFIAVYVVSLLTIVTPVISAAVFILTKLALFAAFGTLEVIGIIFKFLGIVILDIVKYVYAFIAL